ncbi:MAG: DNA primase [Verrucomicrobia bacterium]|nr:MAG: DNA primase [Verrucomicrobiota bacterium]
MAGLFSSATLEQIRAASDIVDVIGSYLPLKRAGANFVALCPFHKEKTPSFNVNSHRQIFHCFGCHKGGDVFTFVQEYENITFPEAVRRLAERAHLPLEFEKDPGQQKSRFLKETLLQIHEQITQRWQAALANEAAGQIARDYLKRRGVSDEAVKLFRLGHAPDTWDDTVNWARNKNYELAMVEQAGLILRKEGSDHYYDRFRSRLIFPIGDEQGRVIGFSGRVLGDDEKAAKYVNSPETPIFTKGRVFFGLDKSKRALLDAGYAVVCEGQLDLIACYMAGVHNVVAPQGTALTAEHARILKRYVDEVVLCFDSDTAGRNAAIRALDDLLASGLAIRVAAVPAPHDPDSFIKESGGVAFQQLISRAEGFFDFYLNHLCATNDVGQDKGRLGVVRAMREALHKTGNAVLADTYAQKTAQRLGVAVEAVRSEFKKVRSSQKVEAAADAPAGAPQPQARPSTPEFWLLKLLLLDDELPDCAVAHLDLNWVQHAAVRQIISARLAARPDGRWPSATTLLTELDDATARSLVTEAVSEQREIPNRSQQLADIMKRLRDQFVDRRLAHLAQRMNQPDSPDSDRIELLKQQQALRQLKQQPLLVRQPNPAS